MRIKALFITLIAMAALVSAAIAFASATIYSQSGSMSYGKPLTSTFTNTQYQDMTITMIVHNPIIGAQYLVALEHFYNSQYTDESCINDVIGPNTTISCTVVNAEPGTWTVYAHPVSGKYGTTTADLVVTTP